ncbi:MAG: acyl-CoA dehydrogenase [Oceanospirillaceae bacterium]|nr:acyl-CoA dehydrogenase [Oceanospirillaceae bacterium]
MDTREFMIPPRELDFQLYEVLNSEALNQRPRFAEHNRETFDGALQTANAIARDFFAPHNGAADYDEPRFDGQRVHLHKDVKPAFDALASAGFIAAREDYALGGMQLPESISSACMALFTAANPSTAGYPFLTGAAVKVLMNFANAALQAQFVEPMLSGRFAGTMALTEPQAGSSLADIKTRATPHSDGTYRIKGNKIFISGGDQSITENIVHLVLAKIDGAPAGVKGISLFAVPKFLLNAPGQLAQRNDVALAGLFHKLGYRGTTSTALSFGEQDNCVGYLIGEPHQGLKYMFQMMNEARLAVGFGAAVIGYRGYQHSLAYAKERPQGRLPSNNNPASAPINIIEHTDVKRMLLAQKAYSEGALALCLYGARLVDDVHSAAGETQQEAALLLDLLTPVLKAWPSEYGVKANDLAIQVLGGAGYTREYPVEQCWRDNRLNPIHEGTNGIQALDLLGRKLWQANGKGMQLLHQRIMQDINTSHPKNAELSAALHTLLNQLVPIIGHMAGQMQKGDADFTLGLATPLLHVMGHTCVAWMWLRAANIAQQALTQNPHATDVNFYQGKIQAAQYFYRWELPTLQRDFNLLNNRDNTCHTMQTSWF